MASIQKGLEQEVPLPELYENAAQIFAGVCARFFKLLGSQDQGKRS